MQIHMNKRFNTKELPDMKDIFGQVDKLAQEVKVGETLFFKEQGVKSEGEYKRRCMKDGHLMKHTQIGWTSWDETAKHFDYIYKELQKRGSYVTRFGIQFDWVMGLPEQYRSELVPGTGLILNSEKEWMELGQIVPVQPHLGDHMIGCPNALENAILGLKAGITTIGNVSHYFTYEYPGFDFEQERTVQSMLGFALVGRYDGTVISSNLCDGYGNLFHDMANLAGWVMMERYIIEDLLEARMNFCYGNLFSDPISRIVFNLLIDKTNTKRTPGSFVFGNTMDYGLDTTRNYGALANSNLADMVCQRHNPTGHAVGVVPVTEAYRIPTPDEIVDAHMVTDMMIEKSKYLEPYLDWNKIEAERDVLYATGSIFFERMMNGLDDLGVDLRHAGEVMATLKAIGAEQLEAHFGVGKKEKGAMRGRNPLHPMDIIKTMGDRQRRIFTSLGKVDGQLDGLKVIVGATDIHIYGKDLVKALCSVANATVFDIGSYITAQEIIDNVLETESKVVLISTYNGIALSFSKELVELLKENGLDDVQVFIGGQINENQDGSSLAVDVSEEIRALGVNADNDMTTLIASIRKVYGEQAR
jgi:methylmalonyl-CoA mutase cobalamin-binding subunit